MTKSYFVQQRLIIAASMTEEDWAGASLPSILGSSDPLYNVQAARTPDR